MLVRYSDLLFISSIIKFWKSADNYNSIRFEERIKVIVFPEVPDKIFYLCNSIYADDARCRSKYNNPCLQILRWSASVSELSI